MKRYITSFLLVVVLASGSLFGFGGGLGGGFGGGFGGFPGLGEPFPGLNPGGIGSGEEQEEEKTTEFTVLAGYSLSFHEGEASHSGGGGSYSGNDWGAAFAPSVQLRLAVNRLQFMVDGTWNSFLDLEEQAVKAVMFYGGAGYQLVNNQRFSLSASVVAGWRSNWWSANSGSSYSYDSYSYGSYSYGSYSDRNQLKYNGSGFLVGADLLAMLKLGKHLGIYANGLLSTGGMGAKLGVAYRF